MDSCAVIVSLLRQGTCRAAAQFVGRQVGGHTNHKKDTYASFSELSRHERQDQDFRIRALQRGRNILVMAPHGGKIEPGTSDIAEGIAGDDFSFYAFEGLKAKGNRRLHVTSTRFDEPQCVALAAACEKAIAIHGEASLEEVAFVGGRDRAALDQIRTSLRQLGFCVKKHPNPDLQGLGTTNICNRTISGMGVQLELSKGLRQALLRPRSKNDRQSQTHRFLDFVAAVRAALV